MNIGIIGFGNVGKAFVGSLINQKVFEKSSIFICEKSAQALLAAKEQFEICGYDDANELLEKVDIVVLAVKPNIFPEVAKEIDKALIKDKVIISFMAGVPIKAIQNSLLNEKITRVMPNMAMQNGNGLTAIVNDINSLVTNIFNKFGIVINIKEDDIEKITALSACGIAYVAYVLESFINSGCMLGLPKENVVEIVNQTVIGAIKLSNNKNTMEVVATKGGATEVGLSLLNKNNVDKAISDAVLVAYEKAINLSNLNNLN